MGCGIRCGRTRGTARACTTTSNVEMCAAHWENYRNQTQGRYLRLPPPLSTDPGFRELPLVPFLCEPVRSSRVKVRGSLGRLGRSLWFGGRGARKA